MRCTGIPAIILAGCDRDPELLGGTGQLPKFFSPFAGGIVGDGILGAIDGLACCTSIYLVTAPHLASCWTFRTDHPLHFVPQGSTQALSLLSGVQETRRRGDLPQGGWALVSTGDLPLMSTAEIETFLAACPTDGEADLYIGMVPEGEVPEALRGGYERDWLPFCGTRCLHNDVYLLRPDAVTRQGYERYGMITDIRRTGLLSVPGLLAVTRTVFRVAGVRGLLPLGKIALSMTRRRSGDGGPDRAELNTIEQTTLRLIEGRFGPRTRFVTVSTPSLALEFDNSEQLAALERHVAHTRKVTAQGISKGVSKNH